jgi:pyridoxamine 5'-phosphate oxidase
MDLGNLRKEYTQAGLDETSVASSPFQQFELWFEQATQAELLEPNAMSLTTVSASGRPSLRTVLLKFFDSQGFVFFTNYSSRKSQEIAGNPRVALLLPWYGLERQVIIEGSACRISTTESLKYFLSRPHGSQLGAWVSQQSSVISSRSVLEMKLAELKRKFQEGQVPLPEFWGGYRVVPDRFEFWQGRPNRLHDRICYTARDDQWEVERLAP